MAPMLFFFALLAAQVAPAVGLTLPLGTAKPGSLSFHPIDGAVCGDGGQAYYGYVEPEELTHPDKFFVEVMGGSVCFNRTSCEDATLSQYMSLKRFLRGHFKVHESLLPLLFGGYPLPLGELAKMGINPGYLPYSSDHPMAGRRGIYLVSCTGDASLGRHNVTYEPGYVAYHHGAINFKKVVDGVREAIPDLKDIAIYGGSAGGVASSVWMGELAEMWPAANVTALVDSGFHLFPGSADFAWFWDNVMWSAGPAGQHAGRIADAAVPDFDWRSRTAVVDVLHKHQGRVKIAYIGCDKDEVVVSERALLAQYSSSSAGLLGPVPDAWAFLSNLHKCAPPGTAYSYVMSCRDHHMTRVGFRSEATLPGTVTPEEFIENVLWGKVPDPDAATTTNFWYEQHDVDAEGGACAASRRATAGAGGGAVTDAANSFARPSELLALFGLAVLLIGALSPL